MKKTDLEKNKALKIMGAMKQSNLPDRFGTGASAAGTAVDRRTQRKIDQEQGLISFPVKIPATLAQEIRDKSQADGVSVNDLVAQLLEKGLGR